MRELLWSSVVRAMTAREAYEEDVRRCPAYHDGTPRQAWRDLSDAVQGTWRRNPTPRAHPIKFNLKVKP